MNYPHTAYAGKLSAFRIEVHFTIFNYLLTLIYLKIKNTISSEITIFYRNVDNLLAM